MYSVIRTYSGTAAKDLLEVIEARKPEVEEAIRSVDGLISYQLFATGDGMASVTVCEDKAGADQSSMVARTWIMENAPDIQVGPPLVYEGDVTVSL